MHEAGHLRFAFITFCREQAFFIPVRQGMEDAARQCDVVCTFDGSEGVDHKAQLAVLENALRGGYDGIALNLPTLNGFEAALLNAREQNIPVVGFNDDVRGSGDTRLAHVSQRLFEAGEMLGAKAKPHIAAGAHIIVSVHSDDAKALEQRRSGILNALSDKGVAHTRIVTATDPVESRDILLDALTRHPDVSAILATGQADTHGAGLAAMQCGRSLYVCGFDTSREILEMVKTGVIAFTIGQQPYMQGYYPVHMLALYKRHGILPADIDAGAVIT